MTLWEVDIHPAPGQPDLLGRAVTAEAADLGLGQFIAQAARGFLIQGQISRGEIDRLQIELVGSAHVETLQRERAQHDLLNRIVGQQATAENV